MRTHIALASGFAFLLSILPAMPRAQEVKLGFVDLQRALNEVDEGKSAKAQLKKEFDQKQKMLDDKQEELKKMKADLDKKVAVMSEDAKREKQAELDKKFLEVQQFFVQLQKELSEREREMTKGIFEKMHGIIREIADSDRFTMVFEKNDAGILFAPESANLTNELIRKYNSRYKGGGGGGTKKKDPKKDK